jgi:hypothetical protein
MARENAVYNPHDKPIDDLPVIYGFNNGGRIGLLMAELVAEDGEPLGGHCCSHEVYMPGDLGILEGSRPDRHESFRKHYPDGYRMEFVPYDDVPGHTRLNEAFRLHDLKHQAAKERA